MKKVSIIIVNYNAGILLKNCIVSILENFCNIDYEIIIIDNKSTDNSVENIVSLNCQNITIILNKENLGFSKANNIGVERSRGEILFFLNPDTKILNNEIIQYISSIDDTNIYTTNLVNENLVPYNNVFVMPMIKNYLKVIFGKLDNAVWTQGSVLLMTKGTFTKIGRWSEDYFMYSEDLDLCYTSFKKNIFLKILPVTIMHVSGGTTKGIWTSKERALRVESSYYKFSKKHSLLFDYHILHLVNFIRQLLKNPKNAFLNFIVYVETVISKSER